jgi:hypothetical protein
MTGCVGHQPPVSGSRGYHHEVLEVGFSLCWPRYRGQDDFPLPQSLAHLGSAKPAIPAVQHPVHILPCGSVIRIRPHSAPHIVVHREVWHGACSRVLAGADGCERGCRTTTEMIHLRMTIHRMADGVRWQTSQPGVSYYIHFVDGCRKTSSGGAQII